MNNDYKFYLNKRKEAEKMLQELRFIPISEKKPADIAKKHKLERDVLECSIAMKAIIRSKK